VCRCTGGGDETHVIDFRGAVVLRLVLCDDENGDFDATELGEVIGLLK